MNRRNKSPYAARDGGDEIQLTLRDSTYKQVAERFASDLDEATASDKDIREKKVRPLALQAWNELKGKDAAIVSPGKWGRWSNLSDEEFDEAAFESEYACVRYECLILLEISTNYPCSISIRNIIRPS